MTNITFYFLLIPFLALALLGVNFLFASHTPYQEKNSTFECGFHSFLGQNRMQFNISFYIFGLLFLLFDLEILLIYPYPVSAQFNSLYGLAIMLIFFIILTLGFTFEFGKNALKIDSRQYDIKSIIYMFNINNNNNKLLSSALFNINYSELKRKVLNINYLELRKKVFISLLCSFIVIIFFSFIAKYFIFSFEGFITAILSSTIVVVGIFLKRIMSAIFHGDMKTINEMVDNKLKTLLMITGKTLSVSFIVYLMMHFCASTRLSMEMYYLFHGTVLLDDILEPRWIDIIRRIQGVLRDPNSRLRVTLGRSKEYDIALTNLKEQHLAAWFNGYNRTPEGQQHIADCKLSIEIMHWILNEDFAQFSKLRGDLRKSGDNVRLKIESLPDNHPGKQLCLEIINRQLNEIKSLANDFDNKKTYPKK